MPRPGCCWRHVTISTLRAWLRGDERGFRSRKHRIHSSGDYRNPPPPNEHRGLRRYHASRAAEPVTIPAEARAIIGEALVAFFEEERHRLVALGVCGRHAHVLVELPDDMPAVRRIVGDAKNLSSRRVRAMMPGRVWAAGGDFERVESRSHHHRVHDYIVRHVDEGGWVWSIRLGVLKGA